MTDAKPYPRQKSLRIQGYDYSQSGAYYVTICVSNKECVLGEVREGAMYWSLAGEAVHTSILETATKYPNVTIDKFVVMPNHVHLIVCITASESGSNSCAMNTSVSLPQIMRALKSISAIRANRELTVPRRPFWQEDYYERIVRDEIELARFRTYTDNNPAAWDRDRENPQRA